MSSGARNHIDVPRHPPHNLLNGAGQFGIVDAVVETRLSGMGPPVGICCWADTALTNRITDVDARTVAFTTAPYEPQRKLAGSSTLPDPL